MSKEECLWQRKAEVTQISIGVIVDVREERKRVGLRAYKYPGGYFVVFLFV